MAVGQKIEEPKPVQGLKSNLTSKLLEKDMAPSKDGKPSEPLDSSGKANSGIKGEIDQVPGAEQEVYYAPNSCYSYYYPGYNGAFSQSDCPTYYNSGDGSYNGVQSDNGSFLYYMPGYNPYTTGYIGSDRKQSYASSGYLQQRIPYGAEAMPYYSWGSAYNGEVANGFSTKSGNVKSGAMGQNGSQKPSDNLPKTLPLNSKARQFGGSSKHSKSTLQTQPLKQFNKGFAGGTSSTFTPPNTKPSEPSSLTSRIALDNCKYTSGSHSSPRFISTVGHSRTMSFKRAVLIKRSDIRVLQFWEGTMREEMEAGLLGDNREAVSEKRGQLDKCDKC